MTRGIWFRKGEKCNIEIFFFDFLIPILMVLRIVFIKRINDCTIFYRFLMFRQWDFCEKGGNLFVDDIEIFWGGEEFFNKPRI